MAAHSCPRCPDPECPTCMERDFSIQLYPPLVGGHPAIFTDAETAELVTGQRFHEGVLER